MNKFTEAATFEDFRKLALDNSLSSNEKVGFPDAYRAGHDEAIFADIMQKMDSMHQDNGIFLDIGPGCSNLSKIIIDHCLEKKKKVVLIDSEEMLQHHNENDEIHKVAGPFPTCFGKLEHLKGRVNTILCYSVFQYVFTENNPWDFIDKSLSLLAPNGEMLIGDIPNISKRKRFFASESGIAFHKKFMNTEENPIVHFNKIEHGLIDDSVVMSIIMRCRQQGFDAYTLNQGNNLPMSNRREDILIIRP